MAGYTVGSSGGDFQDTLRRAQGAASSIDEMNRKEEQRAAAEERATQTEARSTQTRTGLAGATNELTSALERNVTAINAESTALQRNITLMERSVALRREMSGIGAPTVAPSAAVSTAGLAEAQATNAALQAETARLREQQANAFRSVVGPTPGVRYIGGSGGDIYRREPLQLNPGGPVGLLPAGAATEERIRGAQAWQQQVPRTFQMGAGPGFYGTTHGGPASASGIGQEATEELSNYRQQVTANYEALDRLTSMQREANIAFNEAGAIYADTSQALSRHGALTTEFIQAFARGQVTLKEFESQMVSTIGKFGGWAIAGGAVYGVFKMFEDLKNGAVETQAAVQQLGRFIPGLGGPAGGGNSQVQFAQTTVRNISTQFNVPIQEVVDNMQVMARVFHDVASAGDATRAVLAVQRLDQVSGPEAQQYLLGIAQSTGITQGKGLIGVVNQLNALQADYGARVSQTLPAVARAAPAALASGVDLNTLEALSGMGVRAGLSGSQVGTALLRSMTRFAMTPNSQMTLREMGINPVIGEQGNMWQQIMQHIDQLARTGNPQVAEQQLTRLGTALGGPQLGGRTILPILAAEYLHPGEFSGMRRPTNRSYQDDLNSVLGTVTERFKSIGIALQNFGGLLAQSGFLTPITGLLDGFTVLLHVTEALLSPLTELGRVVNLLPGPLKDAVGALIAFRAARGVYNTTFGSAAQNFIGRMPGISALAGNVGARNAVEGTQGRLETYLIPNARNDAEAASRQLLARRAAVRGALADIAQYQQANAEELALPAEDPRGQTAQRGLSALRGRLNTAQSQVGPAEQRVAEATANLAELTADLEIAKSKQYSFADRAAYLEQQGYVAQQETVDLQQRILAAKRAQMEGIVGGGGGAALAERAGAAGGGMSSEALAAGAGVAASAAAVALSKDPTALGDLRDGLRNAPGSAPGDQTPVGPYTPGEQVASVAAMNAQRTQMAREATQGSDVVTWGSLAASARSGIGGLVGTVRGAASSENVGAMTDRLKAFMQGPGLPMAGLFGSQIIGQTIGGGVGGAISTIGGSGFGGMMLAQMLRPGGEWNSIGLGAGLIAGGYQQGGLAGGLSGALGGGMLARGALGLLGDAVAPEVSIPLQILGALGGGLLGSSGGGQAQPSAADIQNQGTRQAIRRLQQAAVSQSGANSFGNQTTDDLTQAFLGSGQTQQNAQARVNAIMKNLTGTLQIFGADSPQGRSAASAMNQVAGAATSLATVDPGDAAQIVQTVTQSRNAEVQRQLQYNISVGSGPGSGQAAAAKAAAQYQSIAQPWLDQSANAQQAVADAQDELSQLQARAAGSTGKQRDQLERQVNAARKNLTSTQAAASAAKNIANLAQQNATVQSQQAAQMGYQADVQDIQAQGQLAQSQAGGNVMQQLEAQRKVAQQTLSRASGDKNLDPRTRRDAMLSARAQIDDANNKMIQQRLAEMQATGQVAEASTPIGRPDIQAQQKLEDLQSQYKYVSDHKKAFDPTQINQLLASVIQAQHDAADAAAQYAIQMSDLQTHISQAEDYGNAVAQANDAVQGALRDLSAAVTPQEKAQARGQYLDALNQQYEAQQQSIQSQGQLQAALVQGDPMAVAEVNVRTAEAMRNAAKGIDNIRTTEANLVNAEYALSQARMQRIQTLAQTQEAEAQANPVAAAEIALNAARQEMRVAQGWSQQQQAEKDLADANYQLAQARLSTSEGTIDYEFQMMQISSQQAINQLQGLLKMTDITKAQRQSIQEQIRRYQLGLEQPIGSSGQFDLAPGNIRLPTYYDVQHALSRAGRPAAGATLAAIASAPTINVYVNRAQDAPKVYDQIDRATGGHLRGRLRAAGVSR